MGSMDQNLGVARMVWLRWAQNVLISRKIGVAQKQYSLCFVPFHYIVSVTYMYFFHS